MDEETKARPEPPLRLAEARKQLRQQKRDLLRKVRMESGRAGAAQGAAAYQKRGGLAA